MMRLLPVIFFFVTFLVSVPSISAFVSSPSTTQYSSSAFIHATTSTAAAVATTTTAGRASRPPLHHRSSSSRRSQTVLSSAKILPIAYTAASAALFGKAITKASSSSKPEIAVLLATSALSLINFGPWDNAKLASAKKAYKNTPPASSGRAKQKRQAAKTWRSVIRIKLIGQLVGLFWMVFATTFDSIMKGAATIMATNVVHFLCGAGRANHDDEGNWDPMPSSLFQTLVVMDSVLMGVALAAVGTPVDSMKRAVLAGIFTVGAIGGALEGVPKFLQTIGLQQKK